MKGMHSSYKSRNYSYSLIDYSVKITILKKNLLLLLKRQRSKRGITKRQDWGLDFHCFRSCRRLKLVRYVRPLQVQRIGRSDHFLSYRLSVEPPYLSGKKKCWEKRGKNMVVPKKDTPWDVCAATFPVLRIRALPP
jgi:hypothetical protein